MMSVFETRRTGGMTNVDPVDIEWLGLKAGDLSDTAVVIQCSFRSAFLMIVFY